MKQTNKQTKKQPNRLQYKSGFYDVKTDSMLDVKPVDFDIKDARSACILMSMQYQSGASRILTPIWCVWSDKQNASIFCLDMSSHTVETMNRIGELMV